MPLYSYVATSAATGVTVKGELEAESPRALRSTLRSKGLILIDCSETARKAETKSGVSFELKRVGYADIAVFTRQLSTLVQAGFQLVPAVNKLVTVTKNSFLRSALVDIKEKLEQGASFSVALRNHHKIFPEFYINMVSAGERAGNLDSVLDNLASFLERQVELNKRVISSLFYPAIMIILSIIVVVVLFTVVVPQIAEIFVKEGARLPFITRAILWLSSFLSSYWWLLAGALGLLMLRLNDLYKTEDGKQAIDRKIYRLPLLGDILVKTDIARFSLTLGSLLKGGVGLVSSLELANRVLKNAEFRHVISQVTEDVKRGVGFSATLAEKKIFPDLFVSMVAVGEQSGELDRMLLRIADFYEKEATQSLQTLVSLIEPVMIILIGLLVLIVVFAVITPIVDMINILKK